jgi:diguanylate cyclase (GGDEF)-like protein
MINLEKSILIQALDQCASGTLVVDARDPRCAIVYANEAFRDLTGWDAGELNGRGLRDFLVKGELPGAGAVELEYHWRSRGAAPVALRLRVAPLYQRPGVPDYWLLSHAGPAAPQGAGSHGGSARTDAVTGLANRQVFDEILRRDWGMARRDQRRLAMIIFRVDALKSYREVFGRHAADACLRKVGHAINGALHRCGDLAARLNSDCFAALVGSADESQVKVFAAEIAERVRDLTIHHPRSPVDRFVTVSAGVVAMVPTGDDSEEVFVERAMKALEHAAPTAAAERASA